MFDSLWREMRSHLGANETLNMETLLETRQVTEVHKRWALSTKRHTDNTHTHTHTYNSPSPSPFILIDPVIASQSHHLHPLTFSSFSFSLLNFLFYLLLFTSTPAASVYPPSLKYALLFHYLTFHLYLSSFSLSFSCLQLYL